MLGARPATAGHRGGVAWMRSFTFPRLLGVVVVLVVGAVGFVGISTQLATAQIADLDPDLCATTYKPSAGAGSRTEADCRTIVAWRNSVVNHPDSVIGGTHQMALWGTASQVKFNTWDGLTVAYVNGERVLTAVNLEASSLGGTLPGELPDLKVLRLRANFLTGELPAWVYDSASLEILELSFNRFSGAVAGERFDAPELAHLILGSNRFSGALPNFDLTKLPKLRNLILTRNFFSGPIPSSWSGFADGRGMQRLDIAYNNISGNLPAWIYNLKFADAPVPSWTQNRSYWQYTVAWQNNRICVPASFVIPEYRRLEGSVARVQLYLEPQRCPDSQAGIIKPVKNLQTEVVDVQVDANGKPATDPNAGEMVGTVKGLKVTWDRPADFSPGLQSSNIKWTYSVWSYLSVPTRDNEVPQQDGSTSYRYCPSNRLVAGTPFLTTETTFEIIITRNNCTITDPNTLYDPTKYTVDIATTFALQVPYHATVPAIYNAVLYTAAVGVQNTWGIYMADDDQKTYRDVANVVRLANNLNIWVWDATNQIWIERDQLDQDFASLNLDPGTALAFQRRVPVSWLAQAGLSTADEDTPVQLESGWNIISAGGDATRPDDNDSAFFLEETTLIDCGSVEGAIVIMRYSARSESFDVELPCHPSIEADMARDTDIGTIEEIEEADTLFIYFRSVLPVTIQWDATNNKYIPTPS